MDDPQYAEELDSFIDTQREGGVEAILVPGVEAATTQDVLDVCAKFPGYLYPALGLHPENVREDSRTQSWHQYLSLKWVQAWSQILSGHTDEWNRTENLEINSCAYDQLVFNKAGKNIKWEKDSLFSKWYWESWTAAFKLVKLEHILTPHRKINSKWLKDLSIR